MGKEEASPKTPQYRAGNEENACAVRLCTIDQQSEEKAGVVAPLLHFQKSGETSLLPSGRGRISTTFEKIVKKKQSRSWVRTVGKKDKGHGCTPWKVFTGFQNTGRRNAENVMRGESSQHLYDTRERK